MKLKKLSDLPYTKQARFIFQSITAGILIAMAGGIYLNCENKYVGAFLFSIGLIAVILLDANLFTGKVGYIKTWRDTWKAGVMLLFNFTAAIFMGMLYKGLKSVDGLYPAMQFLHGPFGEGSARMAKTWYQMFFDGFSCGVFIYLAVELYKKTHNIIPVILCVMGFILSGTEHCIANSFYLGASSFESTAEAWKAFGYLEINIIGNALGSLAIRWLQVSIEKDVVNK